MAIDGFLLWGGIIAGPLFILVFLIEGALRDGYDSMRQPVSALSLGARGWVQQANFFINSILLFACALGLSSALRAYGGSFWAPLLIGSYAAGLFGAGVFVTDQGGSPDAGPQSSKRTLSGVLHDVCSLVVFVSLFIACFVCAHLFAGAGAHAWEVYSLVSGILYGCGFLLFARGFSRESTLAPIAGLLQRITISIGAIWLALVALHVLGVLV